MTKDIFKFIREQIIIVFSLTTVSSAGVLFYFYYRYSTRLPFSDILIAVLVFFMFMSISICASVYFYNTAVKSERASKRIWEDRFIIYFGEILNENKELMPAVNELKISEDNSIHRILLEKGKQQQKLKNVLRKKILKYEEILSKIFDDINYIKSSSKLLKKYSKKFYQSAYSQSSEIEDITNAMNQFVIRINDIAENSNQATQFAVKTGKVTQMGVKRMNEMISAISSVGQSSNKVVNIINTIDGIASKTKLLALNAAIEANRAGEYRQAFGVVANEIRELASHSTKAAKETSGLVDKTIENVDFGNKVSSKTLNALNNIDGEVNKVTSIIEEIAESSNRQAESSTRFNEGLEKISRQTKLQKINAKETTSISEELYKYAKQMEENLDQLKLNQN